MLNEFQMNVLGADLFDVQQGGFLEILEAFLLGFGIHTRSCKFPNIAFLRKPLSPRMMVNIIPTMKTKPIKLALGIKGLARPGPPRAPRIEYRHSFTSGATVDRATVIED